MYIFAPWKRTREYLLFLYRPFSTSFIYSPIKRMGHSKERQRVQSLFISFNTNLCIFYPLFFLWIFLQQNTIFRTFVGWKKTLCKWQGIGLHITHFSMLYSRLVSKRSFLCLENWKTMNKLFGKNTFLWLLIAMVLLGRLLPYRESYNSFFNLGSFIDWGIVVILLVQAATFVLFMSIWRWGDLLFL